jgi:hypothetical protein
LKRGIPIAALLLAIFAQGCATKHYGREDSLTAAEKETLTCGEIELKRAEARAFIDRINKESEFSGLDVLAILIDFGVGNYLEKSSALGSAERRLEELRELGDAKKCSAAT